MTTSPIDRHSFEFSQLSNVATRFKMNSELLEMLNPVKTSRECPNEFVSWPWTWPSCLRAAFPSENPPPWPFEKAYGKQSRLLHLEVGTQPHSTAQTVAKDSLIFWPNGFTCSRRSISDIICVVITFNCLRIHQRRPKKYHLTGRNIFDGIIISSLQTFTKISYGFS